MTLVKICGITNLPDALAAVDAGADALGFNFYQPSPRYIAPGVAREIIEQIPTEIMTVGVFVNEGAPENLLEIAREAGVRALQLHGDESPDYCSALSSYFTIKALSAEEMDRHHALTYNVSALMIDAGDKQTRGGTGRQVDWSLAAKFRKAIPKLFLAGGLAPDNIEEAIVAVRPYAVDACSSLERALGRKNHDRMRAFIKNVRGVKP
jgi:phosphoribosylanthranilate isomerase